MGILSIILYFYVLPVFVAIPMGLFDEIVMNPRPKNRNGESETRVGLVFGMGLVPILNILFIGRQVSVEIPNWMKKRRMEKNKCVTVQSFQEIEYLNISRRIADSMDAILTATKLADEKSSVTYAVDYGEKKESFIICDFNKKNLRLRFSFTGSLKLDTMELWDLGNSDRFTLKTVDFEDILATLEYKMKRG